MTLNTHPNYPSTGCYVLKLHRDAQPQLGHLCGRLEHIVSGEHVDFASEAALLTWLVQHAAQLRAAATTGSADPAAVLPE